MKRDGVPQDKTQVVDVESILSHYGIYLDEY